MPSTVSTDDLLLVALSGGADSVCLLLGLRVLGYNVEALHCNFELRGAESDADEAFCRRTCRANAIPLSVRHFRTKSYAQRRGLSIEMAARQLRYEWFREMQESRSAAAVCVAHHRDDNIETMLLNLVRGTGLRGLAGMQADSMQGGLRILRPLLSVSRQEIEAWLESRGQSWVTDSTNLQEDAALRNRLRLDVIPQLYIMNARVRETLQADIQRFAEAEKLYEKAVRLELQELVSADGSMAISSLQSSLAPRTLLHEWLYPYGFKSAQISEVYDNLEGESGRIWQSPTHRLLRDRGRLVVQSAQEHQGEVVLPLEGPFHSATGLTLFVRRQAVSPSTFVIPRDRSIACFDLEKLELPLTIRRVGEGDRMQPFGFSGTRLVSDIMTDQKLSLFEKEQQLVVLSGQRIVWLVGLRVGAGAEVDATTRHAMTLSVIGK